MTVWLALEGKGTAHIFGRYDNQGIDIDGRPALVSLCSLVWARYIDHRDGRHVDRRLVPSSGRTCRNCLRRVHTMPMRIEDCQMPPSSRVDGA